MKNDGQHHQSNHHGVAGEPPHGRNQGRPHGDAGIRRANRTRHTPPRRRQHTTTQNDQTPSEVKARVVAVSTTSSSQLAASRQRQPRTTMQPGRTAHAATKMRAHASSRCETRPSQLRYQCHHQAVPARPPGRGHGAASVGMATGTNPSGITNLNPHLPE